MIELEQTIRSNNFKIGVLYCKAGQTQEDEMFSNNQSEASPEYLEFLEFLGQKITLKGFKNYSGGLDTLHGNTGEYSIYSVWNNYQVMFHVSTLLPFYCDDPQQLERKRHLGNDIVVIIFRDANCTSFYDVETIKSQFNHVLIVIQPEKKITNKEEVTTYYKIEIARKVGIPSFEPVLPNTRYILPKSNALRHYLFTKIINAERASFEAPSFCNKIKRTRKEMLQSFL